MINFDAYFYEKVFSSLANCAVIMRVEAEGTYYPVWCSEDFAEMMEGTEDDILCMDEEETMDAVHPDDREAVSYLFRNQETMDGKRSLTFRKRTLMGNVLWVKVQYAFIEEDDGLYAYCAYTDVTAIKQSEEQATAAFQALTVQLNAVAEDSLTVLRGNMTTGVIEEIRGRDLYDTDTPGAPLFRSALARAESFLVDGDRDQYLEMFRTDKLLERNQNGEGPAVLEAYCRRASGRQCFVKFSWTACRNPLTGDVIGFCVETEASSEMVSRVLNEKILARQYDMVAYIINGYYGVTIGEASRIGKGSVFPREMAGAYADYIQNQVLPAASEEEHDRAELAKALSLRTIAAKLRRNESYTVDVACALDGGIFNKRFTFYTVDRRTGFYVLLKSDVTGLVQGQKQKNEREKSQAVYQGMLDQFGAMADASLAVLRANLTSGLIEEAQGRDLYSADVPGLPLARSILRRAESFLVAGDREKYLEIFRPERLLRRSAEGGGPASFVGYCRRASGKQCFVKFSAAVSTDPVTGESIAFTVETEHNAEMVATALSEKVLAKEYDMVTYIISGYYSVAIGDAERIGKGSIFPQKRDGIYEDYLREQVVPSASKKDHDWQALFEDLSLETIARELQDKDSYTVDVVCEIGGGIYNKRFTFFAVDPAAKFYLLLKSDMTDILSQQRERNKILTDALREAEQANVAKTAFLSSMSHEIRTPMNAIIGLDSIALKEPGLPPRTREQLEKIGGSANHLMRLINNILDMSRIESGRMTLENQEFSFRQMLEEINSMVHGQCQEKGLNYDCKVIGHVDDFYIGDDMKLRQALINILGNAVKFTPPGGTVNFIVERTAEFGEQSTLRFIVRDTGIGMDKEFLPKLFDVFSQEEVNKANKYGSTGLGMAITKTMVDMMNGSISVESEKGRGSTFTVDVSLKNSGRQEDNSADIRPQDMNVLIIDDDPIACEHAKLVLDEVGIMADTSRSGAEALKMIELREARRDPYDLILVDMKMPEENGMEVTRKIRERFKGDSAVILLTAYSWADIRDEAVEAGVDSFMAKPLFASSVMEQLRHLLWRKRLEINSHRHKAELAGRHILMAEDTPINAEIMTELLEMREMTVDHGENGQIAVDLFAKSEPGYYDAVLMDIRMPVMDGLEATKAIRAMDRPDARTVPIIAMTANAFDEDVQRSLQAGMNAHLTKPVDTDNLYSTLEELIR